jgi:mannose-6-phosphate isomerase-like protein (cupin superfamily)
MAAPPSAQDSTKDATESQAPVRKTATTRHTWENGPRKIGANDGKFVDLVSNAVRYIAWDHETAGLFSVVEHPIPPKTLVAPLHKHTNEDEYSFIIEGRMGAILGDQVVYADAGEFVFKPRNQWHTFWNDGDTTCRVFEIIAPGGFEHYFDEVHDLMTAVGAKTVDEVSMPGMPGFDLAAKYGLEFKPESIEEICKTHGLVYPSNKMIGLRKK